MNEKEKQSDTFVESRESTRRVCKVRKTFKISTISVDRYEEDSCGHLYLVRIRKGKIWAIFEQLKEIICGFYVVG